MTRLAAISSMARRLRIMRYIVVFAAICLSCGSDRAREQTPMSTMVSPKAAQGEPCASDTDCRDGFCDRTLCATFGTRGENGGFGSECEPPPALAPQPDEQEPSRPGEVVMPQRIERECGGYLCINRRCRSCLSDSECQRTMGTPTCGQFGGWPGRGCGEYLDAASNDASPPPPPLRDSPPTHGPNGPSQQGPQPSGP